MYRTPITSSNLKSVGYNAAEKVLEIEFHDGGIYQYFNVPASVYEALCQQNQKVNTFTNLLETSTNLLNFD